jgi:hypothetical protein
MEAESDIMSLTDAVASYCSKKLLQLRSNDNRIVNFPSEWDLPFLLECDRMVRLVYLATTNRCMSLFSSLTHLLRCHSVHFLGCRSLLGLPHDCSRWPDEVVRSRPSATIPPYILRRITAQIPTFINNRSAWACTCLGIAKRASGDATGTT